MAFRKMPFENILGKGENVGDQHFFSSSHNIFYPLKDKFNVLTLKEPFTTIAAFVVNVDQDQAAQNVQPDL